jgi:hypothetical protein
LQHIDVFGDYIAMAGRTLDITIAGGDRPFIALASIEIPDLYYWAIAFSNKPTKEIRGV